MGMLDILRDMFPGRAMLDIADVAMVLNRTGAGAYEQTRAGLSAGKIVPGLRRHINGRWLVPITALAAALDNLVEVDEDACATPRPQPARRAAPTAEPDPPRRRGRPPNSVRLRERQQRALRFWGMVFAHYDAARIADRLGETESAGPSKRGPRM